MNTWQMNFRLTLGTYTLDVELSSNAQVIALIGLNGSGKSTVLRTVAGAHTPDSGSIRLGKQTLVDVEAALWLPPESRHVGYLPQTRALFPHLNVIENVCFSGRRKEDAQKQLDIVGCGDLSNQSIQHLSMGQQQRVAIARALITKPQCLLLDEPLSSIDAVTKRRLRMFINDTIRTHALPTLLVTHDPRDVHAIADEVFVLEHGRIVDKGSPTALSQSPKHEFSQAFFECH